MTFLTEYRVKEIPPDLIIEPGLPPDLAMFLGFEQAELVIAAGEAAADAVIDQINKLA